jgi:hypothetical protein
MRYADEVLLAINAGADVTSLLAKDAVINAYGTASDAAIEIQQPIEEIDSTDNNKSAKKELVELLVSIKPFIATILLAKAVSPTNFSDALMPVLMNISTGSNMVLKSIDVLEKKSLCHLPHSVKQGIARMSYLTIMGGLLVMEIGAMEDAYAKPVFLNILGLSAVSGFTIFSGLKFPDATYKNISHFVIELGLHASSWGFLAKNILAGKHAKEAHDDQAWYPALDLMFASALFILATAYHMIKAIMAYCAENKPSCIEEIAEVEQPRPRSPLVTLSLTNTTGDTHPINERQAENMPLAAVPIAA